MPETIRRATPDDFDRIFHLARTAFPITSSDRDEILRRYRPADNLVLEVDGRILARAVGFPIAHWFGGKRIDAIGVAGVTVSPEARGRRYGTRLVERLLDDALAGGSMPLSTLYPATLQIYRTLGYGDAFHRSSYRVPLDKLSTISSDAVTVREMNDADLPMLIETYERFAQAQNGLLGRDAAWWSDRVLTEVHPFRYLAFRGDVCVGWLIHGFERHKDDWKQDLLARDLVWFDLDAARALLGVAALHRSTCVDLAWTGPIDEPLHAAQHDHAIGSDHRFRAMLRLLDVPAALAARGYPPLTDAEVTLRVIDPLRPSNEGPWRLTVQKGAATVTPGESSTVSATVSVQALASMFSSLLSARDAARIGGLEAGSDAVTTLEAMFAGPSPWLGDFF